MSLVALNQHPSAINDTMTVDHVCFESFNGNLKDGLMNREVLTITEPQILIEQWRREYNQVRPHSSLSYRPPAPETRIPVTLT